MSELIDSFMSLTDVYDKYGIKGCALLIGGVVLFFAVVVFLALKLG